MVLKLIDLSHWNAEPDWTQVKESGIVGVVHKYSQGMGYLDPLYAGRLKSATDIGLLFGRYHFGDSYSVKAQVDNFLDTWTSDEMLALDWENNGSETMSLGQARLFVTMVHDRTGVFPALYSGNAIKDAINAGGNPGILTSCRLWLAHYAATPTIPTGWQDYWLWQYTDKGTVNGISGPVDRNQFDGTMKALHASWI
jgi:lysozyme